MASPLNQQLSDMENRGKREADITTVLDYWLDQCIDNSRPTTVVLPMLRLKCPDRVFRLTEEAANDPSYDDLYYLREFVDEATGENAQDILFPRPKLHTE